MTKLVNKIIAINNRRTSMRLCTQEWSAIKEVCNRENISCNKLIEVVENNKSPELGLTYATRLFALLYFQKAAPSKTSKTKAARNSASSQDILRVLKELA